MKVTQTQRYFVVKLIFILAILFAGLIIPFHNIYADTLDVSTAEELQNYFNSGGNIRLINDITVNENAYITADTTLDLNGYTLNMSDKYLIPYEASFTVEDNSFDQTGTITSTNNFTVVVGSENISGNFNLNSGTIDCQGAYCIYNYDNLVINGGYVSGKTFVVYNLKDFTMNGGFITSEDLTVTNRAEGANFVMNNGTVETTSEDYVAITLATPNTSFTMNDGSIIAVNHTEEGDDGASAIAGFKDTEITINGGTITAYGNAITGNGSNSGKSEGTNAKFTVNGGSITSTNGAGIYAPQVSGVTTITGGTITGITGIEVRAGALNISGGTITATGNYEVNSGINGLSTTGAAISVAQHSTAQPITLTITGGEFSGDHPISKANPMHHDQSIVDQITIDFKGSKFSGDNLDDVTDNIPRGYTDIDTTTSPTTTTITIVPTNPAGYYLSASTSGSIDILGSSQTTPTDYSEVNVLTNCHEGYDVTMSSTVNDNTLYLDSDNSSSYYVSPIEDNTTLISTPNTWGYLMTDDPSFVPTGADLFHPVPTLSSDPAILRTINDTASATDVNDKFRLYFGANIGKTLVAGDYKLISDSSGAAGSIMYQITANPTCTTFPIEIFFNKNLDGEGGESGESVVTDFPTSWDNTLNTDVHGTTTLKLSDKVPIRNDYLFVEWNTNPNGTGTSYQPDDIITVGTGPGELSGEITLYAIWTDGCPGATICYDGNGADAGTMENQVSSPGTGIPLIPSNYSRTGYGFAGWNTKPDGSGTNYGPAQNFPIPQNGGVYLYANWVESAGSLQTWTGVNSMNIGDVTALTDDRDGETYAVAKLADGKIWFIENFRLNPSTANFTLLNTNHPTSDFLTNAPTSSSSNDLCKNNNANCINTISYNTNNLNRSLPQSPSTNDDNSAWYSYGNMYNWYTATAGNGTYDFNNTSGEGNDGTVSGDICPAGWHLPTGNNGEFVNLIDAINSDNTNLHGIRAYPNNFIRSGNYEGATSVGRSQYGRLWSSTASENNKAYRMGYDSSSITPNNTYNKWEGFAIRCIYDGNRIPASEVTVNLDEHVNSISLSNPTYGTQQITTSGSTVTLVNNLQYAITAEFEDGYTINTWSTTPNGQITDPTSVSTNYTVTNSATLSLTTKEATLTTYTLNYDTTPSTDTIPSDTASSYNESYTFEITDTVPAIFGSTFIGWSEDSSATTVDYTKDDVITLTNSDPSTISSVSKTLYAVYQENSCPAGNICYYGNGANSGTMNNQTASSNAQTALIAPNYAKSGYGFAGWITSENATPYGPNATITTPDLSTSGLKLYAKWIASTGNIQNWNGCSAMATGSVTALTDTRDNSTYLVAKLADNNCWFAENLRLNPSTATITAQDTNSPTISFPTEAHNSSSSNSLCGSDSANCDNTLQYNLNNLNRSLTQSHDGSGNSVAWYGYGAYYNWYTATAGNGTYEFTNTSGDSSNGVVSGDICPAGWRLPTGGSNGEYKALNIAINNGATNNTVAWRNYPNNFVYSGEYKTTSRSSTNIQTRLWTATANSNKEAFRMGLDIKNTLVTPEKFFNKWDGLVVRCIQNNSI